MNNSYIDALKAHDWYYQYSDDPSVHARGLASAKALLKTRNAIDSDYKIWNEYAPEDFRMRIKKYVR